MHAQVAQLVEQRTENPRVGGSNPSLGTFSTSSSFLSILRRMTLPCKQTQLMEKGVKIGFCFLTYGGHNQSKVWEDYFSSAKSDSYAIYWHPSEEDFTSDCFLAQEAIRIPTRETSWCSYTVVLATIDAYREALKDPDVTHLVLCSTSCVPIKPFDDLRLQIEKETSDGNPTWITTAIHGTPKKWKCDQWTMIPRDIAQLIVDSDIRFESNHEVTVNGTSLSYPGVPDESFFMGFLETFGLSNRRRDFRMTYRRWTDGAPRPDDFNKIDLEFATALRQSPYFFARKFSNESNVSEYLNILLSCDFKSAPVRELSLRRPKA